jgi:hypothetical protein
MSCVIAAAVGEAEGVTCGSDKNYILFISHPLVY